MQTDNTSPKVPWAGIIAVTIAALAAGFLLLGLPGPAAVLDTWSLTRASGLVAFMLLWLAVVIGLLQSSGSTRGVVSAMANIELHEFVSLAALYTTVFHGVIPLFDHFQPLSPAGLLLPFASDYKPFLVGLGSLAAYISLLVIVSTLLRTHLSQRVWRGIHQLSLVGFLFALLHGWMLGTDSNVPLISYLYRFATLSVVLLTGYRIYEGVKAHARAPGRG